MPLAELQLRCYAIGHSRQPQYTTYYITSFFGAIAMCDTSSQFVVIAGICSQQTTQCPSPTSGIGIRVLERSHSTRTTKHCDNVHYNYLAFIVLSIIARHIKG